MKIGIVSQLVGIPSSTIRYYESLQLFSPSERESGQRVFDSPTVDRLKLIKMAVGLGFSLGEIKQLADGLDKGDPHSPHWNSFAAQKLSDIDLQIKRLEKMQDRLRSAISCKCDNPLTCSPKLRR